MSLPSRLWSLVISSENTGAAAANIEDQYWGQAGSLHLTGNVDLVAATGEGSPASVAATDSVAATAAAAAAVAVAAVAAAAAVVVVGSSGYS